MKIKFWGVRGSIPTPLTPEQVEEKIWKAAFALKNEAKVLSDVGIKNKVHELPFSMRSTYGGNTTCVEIRCGEHPIICDMGTGLREQGRSMMPEIFANNGVQGTILQSHVHWDHIQGMPFWGPMFLPRGKISNYFDFFGGKSWDSKLEEVLQGQMDAPTFPVNLKELQQTGMNMSFNTIYDGWSRSPLLSKPLIRARKLWHPQETFGYEIMHEGLKVVFTTDHEPYADGIPNAIKDLVDAADVWITDCQYSHEMYLGKKDGVQKMGWGHSYPDYIAKVAKACQVKKIVTTHHDPTSTDVEIEDIARTVDSLSNIPTIPAYEGLEIQL